MSVWEQETGDQPLKPQYWLGRIDLRPVALFRIMLGAMCLFDVLEFGTDLRAWFSDEGVLPRSALITGWARVTRFSLLDSFASPPLTWIYWGISVIAAVMLLVGYRTRLAAIANFVLIAGFQERIPPLFDGSDTVMRMVLFWHMFTNSGNVWSADALRAKAKGTPLPTTGPALPVRVLQLQIGWIYMCSVFYKASGELWHNGTSVHYAMHLQHVFARDWAAYIADIPFIVYGMTWGTLFIEASFLPLTHAPVYRKALKAFAIFNTTAMHLGIFATINVGHFSYFMPLTYTALYEPEWAQWVVDKATGWLGEVRMTKLKTTLGGLWAPESMPIPGWISRYSKAGQVALLGMLGLTSWYSTSTSSHPGMPRAAEVAIEYASLWSSWDMFAPNPLSTDYHLSLPAEFENGSKVDLYTGGPWDGPGESRGFLFTRWWKYMENVTGGNQTLPLEWGRYVCREHNFYLKPGEPRLYTFSLYKDEQRIPPIGETWPPVHRQTVWVHRCYDKPNPAPASSTPPASVVQAH
jgi:hypothetical protein